MTFDANRQRAGETPRGQNRLRQRTGDFGEKPLRRYQLTEDLAAGGSAAAVFVQWDSTADEGDGDYDDTDDDFDLYSFAAATGSDGDQGYCWYAADRQRWELLETSGGTFKRITFVTSSALTNQASLSDCAVVLDWFSNTGGLTSVTVWNEMGWQADAGVDGYADWRPVDKKWIIILIPCPVGES